jgi:hypothetical protein
MRKLAALAGAAALGLSAQAAFGYSTTTTVTFNWGGNGGGTAAPGATIGGPGTPPSMLSDLGWTSNGANVLSSVADSTYFHTLSGYNSRSYYNSDFVPAGYCESFTGSTRKYGCRFGSVFYGSTVTENGPTASATGTITVTDTTMTGTLSINATSDEPTGATTTFYGPYRSSDSQGNGFAGYNYRSGEGSPFGNYWQGITKSGTLTLNLTGTFTNTAWNVTGGTVYFTDPGFACQQGGFGGADPGTLCLNSTVAGGQNTLAGGTHLSWGWDVDGARTGFTGAGGLSEIDVRDAAGTTTLSTLSGVLASISVVSDGSDNVIGLTTNAGEYRRGLGSGGGGCTDHVRYDGTKISCGTITTGKLRVFLGTEGQIIPVPAAVWMLGSALGLLGWIRRKSLA